MSDRCWDFETAGGVPPPEGPRSLRLWTLHCQAGFDALSWRADRAKAARLPGSCHKRGMAAVLQLLTALSPAGVCKLQPATCDPWRIGHCVWFPAGQDFVIQMIESLRP